MSEIKQITLFGNLSGTLKNDYCVLAQNNKIYCGAHGASSLLEIDPITHNVSQFGSLGTTNAKFEGIVT